MPSSVLKAQLSIASAIEKGLEYEKVLVGNLPKKASPFASPVFFAKM